MIKHFATLEDLFQEINADKTDPSPSARRYPLRVIFVNTFQSLKNLVSHLLEQGAAILQLKTLLPHDDGWFLLSDILHSVKSLTNDTLIVPFSEVLRFVPATEFATLIMGLFEIENSSNYPSKRIYLPLVGLLGEIRKRTTEKLSSGQLGSDVER